MRSLLSLVVAICLSVSVLAIGQAGTAEASFHCIRIHAVAGGFSGNNNIQFVELRLDVGGQTFLAGHTIQFFNASGTLKATFTFPTGTFPFGASVANGAVGDSVLIATSEFNSNVTGGAADFVFSGANTTSANGGDLLHPVQLTGGSVVWASGGPTCGVAGPVVDSLAYGGATAHFGTAAVALPATGTTQALRLSNLNSTPTDNSTEYALQNVATSTFSVVAGNLATDFTTPRNNGRTVLKLNAPVPSVGGVAEDPGSTGAPAAAAETSSGSRWSGYLVAGGIAAAAVACAGGWYVFRRRTP